MSLTRKLRKVSRSRNRPRNSKTRSKRETLEKKIQAVLSSPNVTRSHKMIVVATQRLAPTVEKYKEGQFGFFFSTQSNTDQPPITCRILAAVC